MPDGALEKLRQGADKLGALTNSELDSSSESFTSLRTRHSHLHLTKALKTLENLRSQEYSNHIQKPAKYITAILQ